MTPRQAQQLLDAQKSEEKALIFRQLINGKLRATAFLRIGDVTRFFRQFFS